MFLSVLRGFLCMSMVSAGVILHLKMKYVINDNGQMRRQDVGLSYENKYIQIDTAALDGKTSATIIHDTTEVMTEYRQAGHCFLLSNGFEEVFSTNMDEWYENKEGVQQMKNNDAILYNYTAAPFCIDREKIPLVMQEECDEVYPAVLTNILKGQDAYDSLNDVNTSFVAQAYGPPVQDQQANRRTGRGNRRKRLLEFLGKIIMVYSTVAHAIATVLPAVVPVAVDLANTFGK